MAQANSQALVTLSLGRKGAEWLALSGPFFEAYARRNGCDFVVMDKRLVRHRIQWRKWRVNLQLEKYQLGPLLDRYERVIFADADLILTPNCPNLFDMLPAERLGVVADPAGEQMWKRDEEMANMQARFGALQGATPAYFNSGLMLLSGVHRELFSFDAKTLLPGRWPEQTALNYYSAKWELPRQYLPEKCNFLPGHCGWDEQAARLEAWGVHYAGVASKELMKRDAAIMARSL
ncbi:MAG: hypothetical protein JW942_09445 [Opitutales bacterium]|nr:hypothetical protein [Opitutales bacterium]